jgi:hypothetical protein
MARYRTAQTVCRPTSQVKDRLVASEFVHRARSAEDTTGRRLEHDVARNHNDAEAALQDRPADGDLERAWHLLGGRYDLAIAGAFPKSCSGWVS